MRLHILENKSIYPSIKQDLMASQCFFQQKPFVCCMYRIIGILVIAKCMRQRKQHMRPQLKSFFFPSFFLLRLLFSNKGLSQGPVILHGVLLANYMFFVFFKENENCVELKMFLQTAHPDFFWIVFMGVSSKCHASKYIKARTPIGALEVFN